MKHLSFFFLCFALMLATLNLGSFSAISLIISVVLFSIDWMGPSDDDDDDDGIGTNEKYA